MVLIEDSFIKNHQVNHRKIISMKYFDYQWKSVPDGLYNNKVWIHCGQTNGLIYQGKLYS